MLLTEPRLSLELPKSESTPRVWGARALRGAAISLAVLGVAFCASFWNALESGHGAGDHAVHIQIKRLEEALVFYAAKHKGRFPSRLEDVKKYMPDGEVPVDAWGNPFHYFSDGKSYLIVSFGADGKWGGVDADADIHSNPAPD